MTTALRKQLDLIQGQLELFRKEGKNLEEEEQSTIEALQRLIDFETSGNDENNPFKHHEEVVLEWCNLNFTPRLDLSNRKDIFAYMVQLMNMLVEELETKVISKEFHEEIIEEMVNYKPDLIITTDFDLNINFVSESCHEILGYKKSHLIGQSILKLFTHNNIKQFILEHIESNSPIDDKTVVNHGMASIMNSQQVQINLQYSIKYIDTHNIDGFIFSFCKERFIIDLMD